MGREQNPGRMLSKDVYGRVEFNEKTTTLETSLIKRT
jgi:hypothetical protein